MQNDHDHGDLPPWHGPPRSILPGTAPTTHVIGRNADTVVALTAMRCYPTGIELQLAVRARRPDPHLPEAFDIDAPDGLRWSIRYPDGTIARPDYLGDDTHPPGPTIVPMAGHGTETIIETRFWLWPLPAEGALTITCAWPGRGVPETSTALDADPLLDAATRAIRLWDPTAGEEP